MYSNCRVVGLSLACATLAGFATAAPTPRPAGPVVQTAAGRIRGAQRGGEWVFKGIPYARPPLGRRRWAPPQTLAPWRGVRAATRFGHDCMQKLFPGDAAPLRTTPSEDCLYLNVWAPAPRRNAAPLPVMVWIYGGGFVNGGSSPAPYSGRAFARDGVVFVSFNYRLGRFGFFAFPALARSGRRFGNYAFMDQIAALHWVQRNIAAFGGNPGQVTVFGESAGGASVLDLMSSPLARGLFARAIVESGGGRDSILPPTPLDHPGPHGQPSAEQDAITFARQMGIPGTGARALAALRRLPASAIEHGLNMASMFAQRRIYSGPLLDGTIIVNSAEEIFRQAKQAAAPLMIGANSADLGFTFAPTMTALLAPFGAHAAAARAAFDPGNTTRGCTRFAAPPCSQALRAVAQRIGKVKAMLEPARYIARENALAGEPAYEYRFSYVAAAVRSKFSGAPHSSEIPYVFDTLRHSMWAAFGRGLTARDEAIAGAMHAYWVHFAKTGNPNGAGLPHWSRIGGKGNQLMNFTWRGPRPETDPGRRQLDLVEQIQK